MFSTLIRKQKFFPWRWWRYRLLVLSLGVVLALSSFTSSQAKSRRVSTSPVKISDVVVAPDPFILGKSALTLTMLVELPASLNGANVLEVSAMITSPTRRSMSFVAHRRLLDDQEVKGKNLTVPIELVWDGKDQYQQLVDDGSYFYELQAKLMEDQGYGPRTKIVSHRVHGTLEALAYAGEVLPPLPPEPDIPEELENPREGESLEEETTVMDEGLKASDDPVVPEEDNPTDAADVQLEESGGSGSDSQTVESEGEKTLLIPEMPESQVPERLNEPRPDLSRPGEEIPPTR
ncbi:MAG: hypothetical protein OEY80_06735 [Nitrospirota bacterium]|nr:hypothetical protein [Nitrospirota bacterium]